MKTFGGFLIFANKLLTENLKKTLESIKETSPILVGKYGGVVSRRIRKYDYLRLFDSLRFALDFRCDLDPLVTPTCSRTPSGIVHESTCLAAIYLGNDRLPSVPSAMVITLSEDRPSRTIGGKFVPENVDMDTFTLIYYTILFSKSLHQLG